MLQERITQAANSNLPIIKKDPRLTLFTKMRNNGFWFLGAWVVLITAILIIRLISHTSIPFYISTLANLPLYGFIGCFISPLMLIPSYKKIEQKRQAAARGEQKRLADQQPETKLEKISLPININYKPNVPIKPGIWVLGVFLLLVVAVTIWLGFDLYLAIVTTALIVVYVAVYIWIKWKGQHELVADETGLTLKTIHLKKAQYIPWSDARLFAIETIPGEAKMKMQIPRLFELASEHDAIFWTGSGYKAMPAGGTYMRPLLLTEEEYAQKLQALHALIVEKTGLMLYDLRKE